ncbi:hypothetical protein BDN71DRAFT_1433791 [Pleurotus eryngii]|uniref:Uncharacterized protein n=1 Tax=Pleurotus eryngii TaxID=5323 RepID=A0A9P5ZQH6_PLEER|nr:hypothetical protein BDN71DRAFT_1433791 [Pleurotus eryngii]
MKTANACRRCRISQRRERMERSALGDGGGGLAMDARGGSTQWWRGDGVEAGIGGTRLLGKSSTAMYARWTTVGNTGIAQLKGHFVLTMGLTSGDIQQTREVGGSEVISAFAAGRVRRRRFRAAMVMDRECGAGEGRRNVRERKKGCFVGPTFM